MTNTISNTDDTIDSRDVIERIEELQGEIDALDEEYSEANDALEAAEENPAQLEESGQTIEELRTLARDARDAVDSWNNSEDAAELATLIALQDEGYCPDWTYGVQLIRDSFFEEYAQELAEDCGMLENCNSWPATCIDWGRAARELRQDYTAVEFAGITYWVRS